MEDQLSNPNYEQLSQVFERFAMEECHNASPLYEQLSLAIARDPELLSLARHSRKGERVPNLFFGAVHFLLLRGPRHPLSAFYRTISETTGWTEDPYLKFRSFCLERADEIRSLISLRLVQTNEVRRCALLLPVFVLISRQSGGRPLALLDIGASAGLNLLWDRYGYKYGELQPCGQLDSPVQITCALRGSLCPPVAKNFPQVSFRAGVDLNPIDVRDPEATLWLRALIWPEHEERAQLLRRAIEIAQRDAPRLIAGDAADVLPDILATIPGNAALCIFRLFTSLPQKSRQRLSSVISEEASKRDLNLLTARPHGADTSRLELVSFVNGLKTEKVLAHFQNHGEWLEWMESFVDRP
jgi:hypothetical protein